MTTPFIKFYDLESYILTDVRDSFNRDGYLSAFDFFCIVIWKANRAKTKIAQRLLKHDSDLEQSVRDLTSKIFHATESKQKMRILICDFGFRLPMASAILTLRTLSPFMMLGFATRYAPSKDLKTKPILKTYESLFRTTLIM